MFRSTRARNDVGRKIFSANDLNPIEQAHAFQRLIGTIHISPRSTVAGKRTGKDRTTIGNAIRLLKLRIHHPGSSGGGPPHCRQARALLAVDDSQTRHSASRAASPRRHDRSPGGAVCLTRKMRTRSERFCRPHPDAKYQSRARGTSAWNMETRVLMHARQGGKPRSVIFEYYDDS